MSSTQQIHPEASPLEVSAVWPSTLGSLLAGQLHSLGVWQAFGLVGGAVAPLAAALQQTPIEVFHFRHESGAAFAATEAYFASGRPTVVFATSGPGITNALTGMMAARWEGAKVVLVSGSTSSSLRGRWACQETNGLTMPAGVFEKGPLFDYAAIIETADELPAVLRRLEQGFTQPGGFVAHVSLSTALQTQKLPPDLLRNRGLLSAARVCASEADLVHCAGLLESGPAAIWVGFGARNASATVRRLAERLGCVVMSTPRAKGIFPETHPLYLGVTGLGGHLRVEQYLNAFPPEHVLVLGTRMGEPSSFWQAELVPRQSFIHVDLDPTVHGVAYPNARTLGIRSDVGPFVEGVLSRLRAPPRTPSRPTQQTVAVPSREGPIRARFLMEAVQAEVLRRSNAVVLTESGNSFAWGNNLLKFDEPNRYRVSVGFGSMGHATTGVVGCALGRRGKAVAIVGDGAMLMNSEISTAVQYGADAVWVVLNDAQYGMVEHGMRMQGFRPVETQLPPTDFVAIARGMGAHGATVREEDALAPALRKAMAARGPYVVDVHVDKTEPGPWMRRIQNLIMQGAQGGAS